MTRDTKRNLMVAGLIGVKTAVLCAIFLPAATATKVIIGAVAIGGLVGVAGTAISQYERERRPS